MLLDLSMPRKNGEETLRELRGIRDDIPIVLSSGFLESDIVSRFGDGELSGVIDKPYRSARLIEEIHEAIRSR